MRKQQKGVSYVACADTALERAVEGRIDAFVSWADNNPGKKGTVCLSFYERRSKQTWCAARGPCYGFEVCTCEFPAAWQPSVALDHSASRPCPKQSEASITTKQTTKHDIRYGSQEERLFWEQWRLPIVLQERPSAPLPSPAAGATTSGAPAAAEAAGRAEQLAGVQRALQVRCSKEEGPEGFMAQLSAPNPGCRRPPFAPRILQFRRRWRRCIAR